MSNSKQLLNVITVQPKRFVDECRALGFIKITDPSKCTCLNELEFQIPYGWMVNQLEDNIVNYPKGQYPIWLWLSYEDIYIKSLKDDYLLICAQVPLERCLISDLNDWHFVLNNWYAGDDININKDYTQTEKTASWDSVLVKEFDQFFRYNKFTYQACIDRIDFSEIIKITSAKDFKYQLRTAKALFNQKYRK